MNHRIFAETPYFPRSLSETDESTKYASAQDHPELCVCIEDQEACAKECKPLQEILVPSRRKCKIEKVVHSFLTWSNDT